MCVGGAGVISIRDRVKLMRLTDVLTVGTRGCGRGESWVPNPGDQCQVQPPERQGPSISTGFSSMEVTAVLCTEG